MLKARCCFLWLVPALACAATISRAQDGTLDPTFGNGGVVEIQWPAGYAEANAVAIDSAGRILLGGYASGPFGDADFALFRLSPSGALDTSFAGENDGFRLIDFDLAGIGGRSDDMINDIGVLGDGSVIAVGEAHFGVVNSQFALAKADSNGALDFTFGSAGIAHFGFNSFAAIDQGQLLRVDSAGRILISGTVVCTCTSLDTFDYRAGVARLTPQGSLDETFNGGGRYFTAIWGDKSTMPPTLAAYSFPSTIVVDASQRIVVAGTISQPFPQSVALMRNMPDGKFDLGFGSQAIGRVLLTPPTGAAGAIWPLSNGKLMVSGSFGTSIPDTAFLTRLNDDGSPDSDFAADGLATTQALGNNEYEGFVFLSPTKSGGWLLAGQYGAANDSFAGVVLVRFGADGTPDARFGANGTVMFQVGAAGPFVVKRAALQPDGKLVLAGSLPNSSIDGTRHFAVLRLLADYDTLFVDGFEPVP